jgi:hypothetical protein
MRENSEFDGRICGDGVAGVLPDDLDGFFALDT